MEIERISFCHVSRMTINQRQVGVMRPLLIRSGVVFRITHYMVADCDWAQVGDPPSVRASHLFGVGTLLGCCFGYLFWPPLHLTNPLLLYPILALDYQWAGLLHGINLKNPRRKDRSLNFACFFLVVRYLSYLFGAWLVFYSCILLRMKEFSE